MAVVGNVLGLAVVGAEGDPRGAELLHEREQRTEVSRAGGLADQEPEPGPEPLPPLFDCAWLHGRSEFRPPYRRSAPCRRGPARPSTCFAPSRPSFASSLLVADDAGEVHHLGQPGDPSPAEEALQVASFRGRLGDSNEEAGTQDDAMK